MFNILGDVKIITSGLYGDDNLNKTTYAGWALEASQPEPDGEPFQQFMVQKIYLISPIGEKTFVGKDGACGSAAKAGKRVEQEWSKSGQRVE